jgi:hypothetical protein
MCALMLDFPADVYMHHEKSPDFIVATAVEDTWLALQFFKAYHGNLTLYVEHQRYHEACASSTNHPCPHPPPRLAPTVPLHLPSRQVAASFSCETIYHADPVFLHQAWTYLNPVVLIPLLTSTLQYY